MMLPVCFVALAALVASQVPPTTAAASTEDPFKNFQIISKPQVIEAKLGDKVRLPCEYKGRPDGTYRLWFQDQNVISVDEKIIYLKRDFALEGMDLVVTVSRPELADKYTCKFNDNQWSNVTHRILLLGPPVIDVDPTTIDVREEGTIQIHCQSQSAPKPTITYTKVGSDIDLSPYVKNGALQINNASRKHAGIYQCTARNGHAPDAVHNITVKYEGRPDVSIAIHWSNLTSEVDKSVRITCKVASETPAKVLWRSGRSSDLGNTKLYQIIQKPDTSTLIINKITKNLFDNYTCVASNSHGDTSDTVEISSLPTKPNVGIQSSDVRADLNLATVSPYRVTKFVVTIRGRVGQDRVVELPLSENDIVGADGKYTLSYALTGLTPDSEYEATAVAYTEKDESSPVSRFSFRTQSSSGASSMPMVYSMTLIACAVLALRA